MKAKLCGIGVDIVDTQKAAGIYRRHRDQLTSLFSHKEIYSLNRAPNKALHFAKLLAIKEAVFKCLNKPFSGFAGVFSCVEVVYKKNKAQVFLKENQPSSAKSGRANSHALALQTDIRVLRHRGFVVAYCSLYQTV